MHIISVWGIDALRYQSNPDHRWNDLFGIELELESVVNVHDLISRRIQGWGVHHDESLRNGIELVTNGAQGGPNLEQSIRAYFAANVQSECTERSSTHIHINMTDSTVEHVQSMTLLMYVLEHPLFAVVGEARKWSGYAMALSEMPSQRLASILTASSPMAAASALAPPRNQDRYYGFNTASLRRHGTVEFRYFPGDPTREELESWLDLVLSIKRAAQSYSVTDITNAVNSPADWTGFIQSILPPDWFAKLANAMTADEMYALFAEVGALCEQELSLSSRREPLIFLTGPMLAYAMSRCKEKGAAYLQQVADELKVITPSEWRHHLINASDMDDGLMNEDPSLASVSDAVRTFRERLQSFDFPPYSERA